MKGNNPETDERGKETTAPARLFSVVFEFLLMEIDALLALPQVISEIGEGVKEASISSWNGGKRDWEH